MPWSLLRTEWLDVPIGPIGEDESRANPTWLAFSESFGVCLRGVSLHVAQRVDDRARLECIVTAVFAENLDILVSHLDDCDKLERMRSAADLMIEHRAAPRRG